MKPVLPASVLPSIIQKARCRARGPGHSDMTATKTHPHIVEKGKSWRVEGGAAPLLHAKSIRIEGVEAVTDAA